MKAAVAILILMSACERSGGGDKTIELPMPKVTVKLIDAGAEPRATLRCIGGGHSALIYKSTTTGTEDMPRRRDLGTTTHSWESTLDVGSDGTRHVHQRVLSARDLSKVPRTVDAWRDARGVRMRPTLMTFASDAAIDDNRGAPEAEVIFPEEPVGVGARWHEDITLGVKTASVDVELLARDGDRIRERLSYHVESKSPRGNPMHRDGTRIEEGDLAGPDDSLHENETFVIDAPDGVIKGTETRDVVRQP